MTQPAKKDEKPAEAQGYQNVWAQVWQTMFGDKKQKPTLQSYEDYAKQIGPKEPLLSDFLEAEQKAAAKRAADLGYGRKGTDNLLLDASKRAQANYEA